MKKNISLLLAVSILLTGCSKTGNSENPPVADEAAAVTAEAETAEPVAQTTTSAKSQTTAPAQPEPQEENALPTMDGSTSAIPLETGMKAALLDIPWVEASMLVSHTKTHIAFQNLLDGTVDLILSVPISDEQQALADEQGVTLTFTPVAKEGFVFVVNADNPVDSLTSEQICAIYSGEITNWKELGGNDEPIVPFQRNNDSGSQNYMTEFMGDVPLLTPESEYIIGAMGALLDSVSSFDNGAGAIGYSVYSYAAQMYADANKIKLVAVDGVKPTKATMADDSYPLSSCTYIITTDSASEKTLEFVEWAISDEGQECVLDSGYLPVNGMDIPAEYMPYEGLGTGKQRESAVSDSEYSCLQKRYAEQIDFLADKDFEAEINAEISAARDKLKTEFPNIKEQEIYTFYRCINGYLEIIVIIWQDSGNPGLDMSGVSIYESCCAFVYDIIEKKKLDKFSDLFFEGADFVPALNNSLGENIDYIGLNGPEVTKADFAGLTGTPECFGLDWLWVNGRNPYFNRKVAVEFGPLSNRPTAAADELVEMMVISEYRDMSDYITIKEETLSWNKFSFDYFEENGDKLPFIVSSRFINEQEIAQLNETLLAAEREFCENCHRNAAYDFNLNVSVFFENNSIHIVSDRTCYSATDSYYDIETGKRLTPSDVFIDEELIESCPENSWICYISSDYIYVTFIDDEGELDCKFINVKPSEINPRYRE